MEFKIYAGKKKFLDENLEILLKDEGKNEIMIGITLEHSESKTDNWLFGRIEDGQDVKCVFLVDDDREGLLFYFPNDDANEEILELLADKIISLNVYLKEVLGKVEDSEKFAEIYLRKTSRTVSEEIVLYNMKLEKIEEVYELEENEKLIKIPEDTESIDRISQIVKDIHTDTYNVEACSDEVALNIGKIYLRKGLYLLTDNSEENIYCNIVTVRKQVNGCAIGAFITLRDFRGKGYGKKCIYSICKLLLDEGNKFIILHVGEQNQSAIRLYERIGFKTIEVTKRIMFN